MLMATCIPGLRSSGLVAAGTTNRAHALVTAASCWAPQECAPGSQVLQLFSK